MPRTIYACPYPNCSRNYTHLERLETHQRQHNGERPFLCTYEDCEKSFGRASHLKRHEETHLEKKFNCTFPGCAKILRTKATLKKHISVCHSEEKPKMYKCSDCNQEFKKHNLLKSHMVVHTEVHEYKCTKLGCNKSFSLHSRLKRHLTRHKEYNCEEPNCQQKFDKWTSLRKHRKECHPRVSKCSYCDKVFSHACNLKAHLLTHKDDKEVFKCTVPKCNRFYQSNHALSDHMRYFHTTFILACPKDNCSRFLRSQEDMLKHLRRRHLPRTRNKKKQQLPPEFAEILAGFARGTPKQLNPHRNKKIDEKNEDSLNHSTVSEESEERGESTEEDPDAEDLDLQLSEIEEEVSSLNQSTVSELAEECGESAEDFNPQASEISKEKEEAVSLKQSKVSKFAEILSHCKTSKLNTDSNGIIEGKDNFGQEVANNADYMEIEVIVQCAA